MMLCFYMTRIVEKNPKFFTFGLPSKKQRIRFLERRMK
jgi:hypothetical protein